MRNKQSLIDNWLKRINLALLLLLLIPPSLMAENSNDERICSDVITYGQNPDTGEWHAYPTPCDVPEGWKSSPTKPPQTTDCPNEIQYAQNPKTKHWYTFSTPCDVPTGWLSSSTPPEMECPDLVTYAQNPKTNHWYVFSTPCDVPLGWSRSRVLPDDSWGTSCSTFYATYSREGKLYIPVVIHNTDEGKTVTYEGINMEYVPQFTNPIVFIINTLPESQTVGKQN